MAQMEYCGTTSFFIRTLLDKKYALPYRVIDALVSEDPSGRIAGNRSRDQIDVSVRNHSLALVYHSASSITFTCL